MYFLKMREKNYTFLRFSLILIKIVKVQEASTFTTYRTNFNKKNTIQKDLKHKKTQLFCIISTDIASTFYSSWDL